MRTAPEGVHVFEGDLPAAWHEAARAAGIVAWDVETSGLDWRTERLGTCQVLVPGTGTAIIQVSDRRPPRLAALLEDGAVSKVFHHAPFDLRFMVNEWQVAPTSVRCTKVASKVLHPSADAATHSLKGLLADVLGVAIEKGAVRTSDWNAAALDVGQLTYAAGDVEYLLDLWSALMSRAEARGLAPLIDACCLFLPARVALEIGGYPDVFSY